MKIADILSPECVISDLRGATKKEILEELALPVSRIHRINLDEIVSILMAREQLGSTGMGDGVAIPHGKVPGLKDIVGALGKSAKGLDFDSIDKKPCHIFFMLLAPSTFVTQHLKALARVATLLKDPSLRHRIMESSSASEIHHLLIDHDSTIED
ncbi:MAG TPA: PTS sugar transporter subunit IIA [Deltaproteobacteria bacterium]|nr:PTS sugar transporter subunit IIA [Deltaproteobacteria bacterium]HOM27916.1 PTS sugar transporter subunit IIA [Deltaproteobacteria bacterium]HPP79643.1 PTS sugar transporter subunit IIA [Deltaproteobacteria bacterium]